MNDQFGGFDLSLVLDSFVPQPVQQQQQQQQQQHGYHSNHGNINGNTIVNGPCMESYDPSQVLQIPGMHTHTSPYSSMAAAVGGQQLPRSNSNGSNIKNGVVRNSHNRHHPSQHSQHNTHQILMPANLPNATRRPSSSSQTNSGHHQPQHSSQHQQQIHQQQQQINQHHHLQTGFPDFEPLPIPKHGGGGSSGSSSVRGGVQQQQQLLSSSHSSKSASVASHSPYDPQHQQQQQQLQAEQHSYHRSSSSRTTKQEVSSSVVTDFFPMPSNMTPPPPQRQRQQRPSRPKPVREEWLENLQVKVPDISLEPMSGSEIIKLLKQRSNEVLTRYLPCVDFLVQCQQELRKGLQVATTKRFQNHMFRDTMTPRQFHNTYIAQLPERFYRKNRRLMTSKNLLAAFKELETLVGNAKEVDSQTCDIVKNTFLGGMKDGESWGLRKWLSKQGGALGICNDTECLSTSCQKLERELDSTCKLAERLRPLAAAALKKLKSDIPSSYQENSSAHPYLPFFHRLECALRGMANFDPEDDDVICIIDDDEVEELKAKALSAPPPSSSSDNGSGSSKRKRSRNAMSGSSGASSSTKTTKGEKRLLAPAFNDDDDDSDIEVLERKPAPKRSNTKKSANLNMNAIDTNDDVNHSSLLEVTEDTGDDSDILQELLKNLDEDNSEDPINFDDFEPKSDVEEEGGTRNASNFGAYDLADGLESLATLFDSDQHDIVRPDDVEKETFWDDRYQYASALRLFSEVLRSPDCTSMYLESVDEEELIQEGKLPYTEIVKHPLCFRDIVAALLQDYNRIDNSIECSSGVLPCLTTLDDWNMWKGRELLQAIDLVFLNSLAYGKANDDSGKSNIRSRTNKLRKVLWAGIKDVVDETLSSCDIEERRKVTPTRRGESSGFVVKKRGPPPRDERGIIKFK